MVGMRSPPALRFDPSLDYTVQNVLLESLPRDKIVHPIKTFDANAVYPETLLRLVREANEPEGSFFWFTLVVRGVDNEIKQFVLQATNTQVQPRTNKTRDAGVGLATWVAKTLYPSKEKPSGSDSETSDIASDSCDVKDTNDTVPSLPPAAPEAPVPVQYNAAVATTTARRMRDFFLSVRFVLPFIVLTMMGIMAGVTITLLSNNTTEAVGEVIVIMQNSVLETLEARVSATLGTLVAENTRFASEVAEFGLEPPPQNATRVSPKDFRYAVAMDRTVALSPVIDGQLVIYPDG